MRGPIRLLEGARLGSHPSPSDASRLPTAPNVVLATGFCGGYTTFSTFTFETVRLIEEGAIAEALLNVAATSLTCGTAAAVGLALASM